MMAYLKTYLNYGSRSILRQSRVAIYCCHNIMRKMHYIATKSCRNIVLSQYWARTLNNGLLISANQHTLVAARLEKGAAQ